MAMTRSAEEWRLEYTYRYHRPVQPATLLSDVLNDLEALEASIAFLETKIRALECECDDLRLDVLEMGDR